MNQTRHLTSRTDFVNGLLAPCPIFWDHLKVTSTTGTAPERYVYYPG